MHPGVDHRPWPLPASAWFMAMRWEDLLFAHWPVPAEVLRPLLPRGLELDTFEGTAWLGVVPFRMAGTRPRWLPPVPGTAAFPELNVRTYVTRDGKPGVWFFSLDAGSLIAVRTARTFFHLPYFDARMTVKPEGDGFLYESARHHRGAPAARFKVRYRPRGEAYQSKRGSLEHWLTERYCLYAADPRGNIWRGEVHHGPWPLQRAEAEIEANTMAAPIGIDLREAPAHLHFTSRMEVVAWRIRKCAP